MLVTHVLHLVFGELQGNWFALIQLGVPPIVLSHVWMRKRPYSIWGAFLRDDNCMFSFHLVFYPMTVHVWGPHTDEHNPRMLFTLNFTLYFSACYLYFSACISLCISTHYLYFAFTRMVFSACYLIQFTLLLFTKAPEKK
jgi:hypothetical protein